MVKERSRAARSPTSSPPSSAVPVEDSDPFVSGGDVWDDRTLRWFLHTGTPDLGDETAALQRAFDTWAGQVPLTFTRVPTAANAHFTVEWVTGDHGDGFPFDGSGTGGFNIYAHAFYPEDGWIHFDEAETWAHSHGSGNVDLESVALHEIGHAIGQRHSGLADAVMYFAINSQRRRRPRHLRRRRPPDPGLGTGRRPAVFRDGPTVGRWCGGRRGSEWGGGGWAGGRGPVRRRAGWAPSEYVVLSEYRVRACPSRRTRMLRRAQPGRP